MFKDNDVDFYTPRLSWSSTGAAITNASLTLTIKDPNGSNVSGATSLALTHVGNGSYRVTVPSSVSLTVSPSYTVTISGTAVDGSSVSHAYLIDTAPLNVQKRVS